MKKEYVVESGAENNSGEPPDWIIELAVTLTKYLQGKTIAVVRYTTEVEEERLGFKHKAPLIVFTDGTILIPCYSPTEEETSNILLEAGEFVTNIDGLQSIPSF